MQKILPKNLITLALRLPTPLYVVGGSVRDFLANLPLPQKLDLDICAPLPAQVFAQIATELGFKKSSVSVAMKHLRENAHITVTDAGFIYLTESGKAVAVGVII